VSFLFYFPGIPGFSLVAGAGGGLDPELAGDLALAWSSALGDGDLSIVDLDLATERGLLTAVLLSLFLDRRAEDDDVPPSGDPRDRRGWWADEFAAIAGDKYGSRLWLLAAAKRNTETILRAKEYCLEAFAWMVEDRVVARVDVSVDTIATAPALFAELAAPRDAMLISIGLQRPGKDAVSFRFAHAWDHLQEAA
jgi:phage gp46-like protein